MLHLKKATSSKAKLLALEFEPVDWKVLGPGPIIGVDEVGRGCLAGPVVAGAALLRSEEGLEFLTDSKLLSEKQREEYAPLIEQAHWVGIGVASVEEIDSINILQASLLAMRRAVEELEKKMNAKAGHVLIDGNKAIPRFQRRQTTFVKGDLRVAPISAAAIVAKVFRDRMMRELGGQFPHYGFESHKGYASPVHKKAIADHGPCLWHRKTFAGVKEHL